MSRDHAPVRGYVGDFGSGKSYTAVRDVWEESKRDGLPVYSNLSMLIDYRVVYRPLVYDHMYVDPVTGNRGKWGMWCPKNPETFGRRWAGTIRKLEDLLNLTQAIVFIDEIQNWWSSKEHQAVSVKVTRMFNQQRKKKLRFRWTSPHNGFVYNGIREMTESVWACSRNGAWSCQEQIDTRASKSNPNRSLGRRFVYVAPEYYDLYNSYEVVGDSTGKDYSLGAGWQGLRPEQVEVGRRKFGPSFGKWGHGTGHMREEQEHQEPGSVYQMVNGIALPWRVRYSEIPENLEDVYKDLQPV